MTAIDDVLTKKCSGECGDDLPLGAFDMTSRKYGDQTYKYRRSDCKKCRCNKRLVKQQLEKEQRAQQLKQVE